MARWNEDLPRLRDCFGILADAPECIVFGCGDYHRGGRSVTLVQCAGQDLYFKPRDVSSARAWDQLCTALQATGVLPNGGLAPARIAGEGYYWEAALSASPTAGTVDYELLGALLAIFTLVGSVDMYADNLLITANGPILLDAETFLHGSCGPVRTQALSCLLRSGVLPVYRAGADGRHGERSLLMRWMRGSSLDALHAGCAAFETGFARTLRAMVEQRRWLEDEIHRCYAGVSLRYLPRPTSQYTAGGTPPDGWRPFETRSLVQGDVPLVTGVAERRDLFCDGEPAISLDASPLEVMQNILRNVDDNWRDDVLASLRQRLVQMRALLTLRAGGTLSPADMALLLFLPALDRLLQAEPVGGCAATVDWHGILHAVPDRSLRDSLGKRELEAPSRGSITTPDVRALEGAARHFCATGKLGGSDGISSPAGVSGLSDFCRGLAPWLAP